MFKFLTLKLKRELEEVKSLHRIELAEKEADLKRAYADKEAAIARVEKDLKKENEIKTREVVSLLKLEAEQKQAKLGIDAQVKINQTEQDCAKKLLQMQEALVKEHYEKLSEAMTKLHEEGNLTTKFTQELALKMMGGMPANKSETKVITGSIKMGEDE